MEEKELLIYRKAMTDAYERYLKLQGIVMYLEGKIQIKEQESEPIKQGD